MTTLKKQVGNKPQSIYIPYTIDNNFKVNQYKVKYGFDASQYFFRGEKKYEQGMQRHIHDNLKQTNGPVSTHAQMVSVEKLLIMCRNLNPDIYKQLIDKYQNTDEFYNNYINKNVSEQVSKHCHL